MTAQLEGSFARSTRSIARGSLIPSQWLLPPSQSRSAILFSSRGFRDGCGRWVLGSSRASSQAESTTALLTRPPPAEGPARSASSIRAITESQKEAQEFKVTLLCQAPLSVLDGC